MYCLVEVIRNRTIQIEEKASEWLKNHQKMILLNVIFGIMVYFMMIAGNLVNSYDGIWNTSYFVAGSWEASLGRGLLHYVDKVKAGIVSMPFNTILTVLIISITSSLILDLFVEGNRGLGVLVSLLLIANPVICVTLSYCYTSVGYSMAFLFSVLSVLCINGKHRVIDILFGAAFIAMSLGCYQAYFGVTCFLLLLQVIRMLLQNVDAKKIVYFILKGVLTVIVGGVFYIIITNMLLYKYGIRLSSYKGASQVSIRAIITFFPSSVLQCYRFFYQFLIIQKMAAAFSDKAIIIICGIGMLFIVCVVKQFIAIWHRNNIYALCFLLCIFLVPVACNAIILLAVESDISLLMSMGMVMSVTVLPVVILPVKEKKGFFIKWGGYALMFLLLWMNILTITNDQVALKEGKNSVTELTTTIVDELISGGYFGEGTTIAFVGKPCENSLFVKSGAWNRANWYAKFGDYWGMDAGNNFRSWAGVLAECCGINLKLCSIEKYEELYQKRVFFDMPDFPAKGSIKEIDGVIVIKVSGKY